MPKSRKQKPLIILGVEHTPESEGHEETLAWIRENVKPGMRIGVEFLPSGTQHEFAGNKRKTLLSEKELALLPKKSPNRYWLEIAEAIRERRGTPVPLERHAQWKKSVALAVEIIKGTAERPMKKMAALTVLRSKNFLRQALAQRADAAIMGSEHAMQIKLFAPHIPLEVKRFTGTKGKEYGPGFSFRENHPLYDAELARMARKSFQKIRR